jgi:radical SAM superfamily enzyme YgiQ (UPF0313 family)
MKKNLPPNEISHIAIVELGGFLKDYTTTHFRMPRIGPVIIGSLLEELGYNVKVFAEAVQEFDKKTLEYICSADVVAMSVLTYGANRAYALAKLIKQINRDSIIIMGDVHPTIMPEECLAYCDFVIRGEGDETIVELLSYLEDGTAPALNQIAGLSYWDEEQIIHNSNRERPKNVNVPADLSLVEGFVRPDLVSYIVEGRGSMSVVQASRGCPIACKFCLGSAILGKEYRAKDIERVLNNLNQIRSFNLGKGSVVFFIDNHFFINRQWTKALLREIIAGGYDFRFIAFGQYFIGRDREMLDLLREAGFIRIFVGFESINPQTLKDFNKKQSEAAMRECISVMHEHGVEIHGSFILGGETDDEEVAEATIQFALDTEIMTASFFSLTEYPFESHDFIPATNVLPKRRLLADDLDYYNLNFVSFYPKLMKPSQLQRKLISAYDRFFSPKRIAKSVLKGDYSRAYHRAIGYWGQRKMIAQMRGYLPYLEVKEREKYTLENTLIEGNLDNGPSSFVNSTAFLYHQIYG